MENRYGSFCHVCKKYVAPKGGYMQKSELKDWGKWIIWCGDCWFRGNYSPYEAELKKLGIF